MDCLGFPLYDFVCMSFVSSFLSSLIASILILIIILMKVFIIVLKILIVWINRLRLSILLVVS